MNTSRLMTEFADLQQRNSKEKLKESDRQRFEDLRHALLLASRNLPVTLRQVEATGPRMRIKDGREVREVALEGLSKAEVEVELESPMADNARTVVAVVPGPGVPAYAAVAHNHGPSDRGNGWYRLAFDPAS